MSTSATHNAILEAGGKDRAPMLVVGSYKLIDAEAEAIHIILTGIDNDNYSTVDACANSQEMWLAIKRLIQGENINKPDVETNLFWAFGKFTSRDGESLDSYHSRFYKVINELIRSKCEFSTHQINVQFLFQLQLEWQRSVAIVKQGKDLKKVSYHTLFDILKQHQNESKKEVVGDEEDTPREKEIDKLGALILTTFKKIYKPTNSNLITSSNTKNKYVDNILRTNKKSGYERQTKHYENHGAMNVAGNMKTIDDGAGPVFDKEPLEQVHTNDEYNVFAMEDEHNEKPESVTNTYIVKHYDSNTTPDSTNMSNNG
ncbi:hypothetical protein Tco_0320674 [Tanacetum coccineum]